MHDYSCKGIQYHGYNMIWVVQTKQNDSKLIIHKNYHPNYI